MCRRLPIAALAAVGMAAALGAQTAAPQKPAQQPTFRTEANFVRVDVYPTRDGRPVEDLNAADFELLEDGVRQTIDTFEHVVVKPAGPQATRLEPNTIEAAKQLAANPRARVFVVFLDVPHVSVDGSTKIREPLIRLIDRILGPDDLVGIMTPDMAASDLVLGRKTEVLANGLGANWSWGERSTLERSPRELEYERCYPPTNEEIASRKGKMESDLAREMIARRRERATLDSLNELVRYLRILREERKAILTVTEGWELFRPNESLLKLRNINEKAQDPMPGVDPIGAGPTGKITTKDPRKDADAPRRMQCDNDRMELAYMDDARYFKDLMSEANRANASFYTIDPRGLAASDVSLGPEALPRRDNGLSPLLTDLENLRRRQDAMRILAAETDGISVMNSNDLDKGLKRVADDLTSYYLLGYYSTNTKLDGKFRAISVRVKRDGVGVRARRGYRAATVEEVSAARKASASAPSESTSPVVAAIAALERVRPEQRLHVNAAAAPAGEKGVSKVWVAGEVTPGAANVAWPGGTAEIEVRGAAATGTATVNVEKSARAFLVEVPLSVPVASGALDIRVRLSGASETGERPASGIRVPVGPRASGPLVFRRGPSTGNRPQPAALLLFTRSDRVRIELPALDSDKPGTARLLDRTGQLLGVPVTTGERVDQGTGDRWLTADLTLAPLAFGDYVIEIVYANADGEERVLTPIRVVR